MLVFGFLSASSLANAAAAFPPKPLLAQVVKALKGREVLSTMPS